MEVVAHMQPPETKLAKTLKSLWLTIVLLVLLMPVMFSYIGYLLMEAYPDAGAGAMIFFPIALVGAPLAAGALTGIYLLLVRKVRYWAGIPIILFALGSLVYIAWAMVTTLSSPALKEAFEPGCAIVDPKPGQNPGNCAVEWTVTPEENPARELFAEHGWKIERAGMDRPQRVSRSAGSYWQARKGFSADSGLTFSVTDGQQVRVLSFPVSETRDHKLVNTKPCTSFQGAVVLSEDRQVLGAWVDCRAMNGGASQIQPGYSLKGRDIEQITGLTWRRYKKKYD